MNAFLKSMPGRLLTLSTGLSLLLGGISVMLGPGFGTPLMCIAVIVAMLGGLFAAGLASMEQPGHTLVMVLAYPEILFGSIFGLSFAVDQHLTIVGVALAAAGVVAISAALPSRPSEPWTHGRVHPFVHRSA